MSHGSRPNFSIEEDDWKTVGLILLSVRFVQGWIFWAGGSRRFIYAPQKLDPHSQTWLANKLQSAMPGALLGVNHIISFLLQHFYLLYIAIILFSLTELFSGAALLLGFFTRLAAFLTVLISIALMLIFGWQGSTCLDEWTMAISTLAMGFVLVLAGSPTYSIDNWLLNRYPSLIDNKWFENLASGEWTFKKLKITSLIFLIFTVIFTLASYNYFRGAIFTLYHPGPVSAAKYHYSLNNGRLLSNGGVNFHLYVDAGATATPSHIVRIELRNSKGELIEEWDQEHLSKLPIDNIRNEYAYNRITTGPYGLVAPVSAKAILLLPPTRPNLDLPKGTYQLQIYTVNGVKWAMAIQQ